MLEKCLETIRRWALIPACVLGFIPVNTASADGLNLYIDADFSNAPAVAEAIELGLRSAMAEVDNTVAGLPVTITRLDHRKSPRRSENNFRVFLRDPLGIAVFGGQQSPPYLSFGEQINANGIPLFLSWAAAGPMTRYLDGTDNFIFRLSVDDSKAGPFLVRKALAAGCRNIALVLSDTGWGRANRRTIAAALEAEGVTPVSTHMLPGDVGPVVARSIAHDMMESRAECALTVLVLRPGVTFLNALQDLPIPLRMFTHWGMMSEDFHVQVPADLRRKLSLRVLQTCGLKIERAGAPILDEALELARTFDPDVRALKDIPASAGFVHAFDFGRLFRTAAQQAAQTPEWSQGPVARRRALRDAMANLKAPVAGIIKTYDRPFSDLTPDNRDGHEALGPDDLCLTRYAESGELEAFGLRRRVTENN